jgi:hypothetical protein
MKLLGAVQDFSFIIENFGSEYWTGSLPYFSDLMQYSAFILERFKKMSRSLFERDDDSFGTHFCRKPAYIWEEAGRNFISRFVNEINQCLDSAMLFLFHSRN